MGKRWEFIGRNPITGRPYFTPNIEVSKKEPKDEEEIPVPTQKELPPIQEGGRVVRRDLTHAGHSETAREEEEERREAILEKANLQKTSKEGE